MAPATLPLETLWDTSPCACLLRGPAGILAANAAALELFGLDSPEALLGHCTSQRSFSPERQPSGQRSGLLFAQILDYACALARERGPLPTPLAGIALRAVGGAVQFEWQLLRRDGTAFAADMRVRPVRLDALDGHLLICQDVSQHQQAQAEGHSAEVAAEDLAHSKARLLAHMGRHIRPPTNAIVGLSHLVLRTELSRTQRDFLTRIQEAGQQLLGSLNDVMDYSATEAGQLTLATHEFALGKLLDRLARQIGDKARSKGLELVFDIDPEVPDYLQGDALRLGQILSNYANNALTYTHSGEICIAIFPLAGNGTQLTLRFEVRDTGIGLSDGQQAGLFQGFGQADSRASHPRSDGGLGLGLAIASGLARLMHGNVGVASQPGRGSTFWFTAELQRGRQPSRRLLPAPALHGRRVLLVDDNGCARRVLQQMLLRMAFVVDVLDAGVPALAAVQQAADAHQPYEIVFLDWHMRDLMGLAVARHIRTLALPLAPAVVLLSAFDRDTPNQSASCAGVDAVLPKPVCAWQLLDIVGQMLAADVATAPAPLLAQSIRESSLTAVPDSAL